MIETYEAQVRAALDAKAREIELPADLETRTMNAVRATERSSRTERRRARRDSRKVRVSTYPRWAYATAAVAAVVVLFAVGAATTRRRSAGPARGGAQQSSASQLDTAVGGATSNSLAGVGDARGSNSTSGDAVAGSVGGGVNGSAVPAPTVAALPSLPKVVRTADIKVQVRDFEKSWRTANDTATRNGGFVTNSNTEESGDHVGSGTLTMRVPSSRLDNTLRDLRALGTMTRLTTSGNDVSAPVADLQARKKTAEAEEAQLLNLLNNANNVTDVLDIRNRLNETRTEIESIEGQINSYQDQVDFSTINASVFEKGSVPTTPGRPILGNGIIGGSLRTAVRIGLTIVAGIIVLLGGLLPLAALVLGVWFVVRVVRRREI